MRYHNITKDDMLNGDGLRVVLWVAGCEHHCNGCHNAITWDINGGIQFDESTLQELYAELVKDHISGITFSGGDPLHPINITTINELVKSIKLKFPGKNIWLYTGYVYEDLISTEDDSEVGIYRRDILNNIDVLVDGKFVLDLKEARCPWVGSTNQRVINMKESLSSKTIILH